MLISFVLTVFLSYSTSKKFSFTFFQEVLARKVAQETMEEIFVGSRELNHCHFYIFHYVWGAAFALWLPLYGGMFPLPYRVRILLSKKS